MKKYLVKCVACHNATSRAYARAHQGKCKPCVTGWPRYERDRTEGVCHAEQTHSFLATEAALDACPF